MPSTASPSILAELQAAGENLNTWGDTRLNTALSMLEAAGHGLTSHTLTADKSLTYANFTATDGTDYVQKIAAASDGAYTITLGGYERSYLIWNASSFDQIIACSGGGTSATVYAGEVVEVYCDGTNVARLDIRRLLGLLNAGGFRIENLGAPTANGDAVTKQYADGLAMAQSDLPGQTSGAKFAQVTSDGSAASWHHTIQPEVKTVGFTAIARVRPYLCVMAGGAYTLTLPASPQEGDIVRFMTDENASDNNLTVGRNGETIGGVAEDMTVTLNGFSGLLFYTSSDWKVTAL